MLDVESLAGLNTCSKRGSDGFSRNSERCSFVLLQRRAWGMCCISCTGKPQQGHFSCAIVACFSTHAEFSQRTAIQRVAHSTVMHICCRDSGVQSTALRHAFSIYVFTDFNNWQYPCCAGYTCSLHLRKHLVTADSLSATVSGCQRQFCNCAAQPGRLPW